MTPIRRLLNIVQFDLAEKLNLARLRWYHLNQRYSKPLKNMMIGGISLRKRIQMLSVKMRNM